MKKNILVFLFSSLIATGAFAQDDLLKQLQAETPPPKNEPVLATFKGNKIINIQTNETVKKEKSGYPYQPSIWKYRKRKRWIIS